MKYTVLVPFTLLGSIVASPTASNPSITFAASSTFSCINGTANTVVKTIDSEEGSYDMIHTLDSFEPAQEQAQAERCSIEFSIGVLPGYRARANKNGVNIAGYINLDDAHTSADFSSRYSFASDPSLVVRASL